MTEPLKPLQIVAGLDPLAGGPPVSAVATAVSLRLRGMQNEFAYTVELEREDATAGLVEHLSSQGIRSHAFPQAIAFRGIGRRWGVSPALAVWLWRNARRFDVVHVHSGWTFTAIVGLVVARLRGRAAVLSSHESLTDFDRRRAGGGYPLVKRLLRWVYLRAFDVVIASSELERTEMGPVAERCAVVVPHAVLLPDAGASDRDVTPDQMRVGFLGRLNKKKNVETIIDALAESPDGVSLEVAGDGPPSYREALMLRAEQRGVAHRIMWRGFLVGGAKAAFLAGIDVLAMPSDFECFGVAAVEALGAGAPVIVSPLVGVSEIVGRYGCGAVVPVDVSSLASQLTRWARDRESLRRAAARAREAAAEFTPERHGVRIEDVYRNAIAARSRRRRVAA